VTRVAYSEVVGRRIREGSWEEQKVSTYRRIQEAIAAAQWEEAAALAHYFVDEAQTCFAIYRQWIPDLHAFLADHGVSGDELERVEAEILAKLALPDGRPFDPRRHWDAFLTDMEALAGHCHRREADAALRALEAMKTTWRQCHDRDADHAYGLMHEVKARLGEDAIGPMFERVLLPLFAWRYDKFDVDRNPWEQSLDTLMLVGCEAMRGHLVGPERTGDFELVETDDRFVLRFAPCGTGGRTLHPDLAEGTPPRMEPPYGWSVSEEPHSWNHYEPGLCLYCAHCIVLQEEMPIDRFGYPLRVIDPPRWTADGPTQGGQCQWTLFKDLDAVPDEIYERVGRVRPERLGSSATGAGALEDRGAMPGTG
jgi:hypothetical protein